MTRGHGRTIDPATARLADRAGLTPHPWDAHVLRSTAPRLLPILLPVLARLLALLLAVGTLLLAWRLLPTTRGRPAAYGERRLHLERRQHDRCDVGQLCTSIEQVPA